jgi:spermidine synthase
VIPWVQLDTATVPDGGGELRLMQRGAEFAIMLDRAELMNSRRSGSEEALATLACARLRDRQRARLLIGGLGMGFTLRAALAELGAEARVTVAELVPEVIAWASGKMAAVFGSCLTDPRVSIQQKDVGSLMRAGSPTYDAILLDVDNGPDGLSRPANDGLYNAAGLDAARTALHPGGVLAVWSAGPDQNFTKRLRQAGFAVEELKARSRGTRGATHVVWIATKAGGSRGAAPRPGSTR